MNSLVSEVLKIDPKAPQEVWMHFSEFCKNPRPSKHEEKIRAYLKKFATDQGLSWKEDAVGNTLIYVPGSNGYENCEPILIQNHVDMVTDALPEVKIDFFNDPIIPFVDGEWVKAQGTTLGADNGIGSCLALCLINHREKIKHPPLELLFTIDEETGLTGALELDASMIKSKIMLNLDTEEWGALYIGCAGGIEIKYHEEYNLEENELEVFTVKVAGLIGGHSGLDIHRQRGNANIILADLLSQFNDKVQLVSFNGGKAHNIIPRNAVAVFALTQLTVDDFSKIFNSWKKYWEKILPKEDKKLFSAEFSVKKQKSKFLPIEKWQNLNSFLQQFPHGAHQFVLQEGQTETLVRLSNNLAKIQFENGRFTLLTSIRFFEQEEGDRFKQKCLDLGRSHKLKMDLKNGYPSWTPDFESKLLSRVVDIYQKNYGSKPEVKAIHAGLECGIILAKKIGMEAVSMGPLIVGAHSPDEKVLITDVTKIWNLLCFVLADLVG